MYGRTSKKADEQNIAQLKELAHLPDNKHCFDCGQRGPTYLNMTIGSFVCTSCSGMLRGLNPPHRLKSISMATFSSEEVQFVRQRGNEVCRRVWLGLRDSDPVRDLEQGVKRDEYQMKDHLIVKYEKKRWYVAPSEVARQTQLYDQATNKSSSNTATNSRHSSTASPSVPRPLVNGASTSSQGSGSLVDIGAPDPWTKTADPWGVAPAAKSATTTGISQASIGGATNGFADFDSAFSAVSAPPPIVGTPPRPHPHPQHPAALTPGPLFPPPTATPNLLMPKSQTMPAGVMAQAPPPTKQEAMPMSTSSADKYSALAELDELFHSSVSNDAPSAFGSIGALSSNSSAAIPSAAPAVTKNNPFLGFATDSTPVSSQPTYRPPGQVFPGQSNPFAFATSPQPTAGFPQTGPPPYFQQPQGVMPMAQQQSQKVNPFAAAPQSGAPWNPFLS